MTVPLERRLDASLDQRVQRDGRLGFIDIHLVGVTDFSPLARLAVFL